mmetsp:Transcript_33131/g.95244  ORF Transcript_33131/g.95244 Transcript_33131/m.95244 type:complete len:236 (-) Transcript_33131:705-1412(-)
MEGRLLVRQEQVVVGTRRHSDANATQVVEVLQRHRLPQVQAVRDAVGQEEGGVEVVQLARLPSMRSVGKLVEAKARPQAVQHPQVALQVEVVVLVRGVRVQCPLLGCASQGGGSSVTRLVALGLVVHGVEAGDQAHELRDLGVGLGVQRGLEHRHEDVVQHVLEAAELARCSVDGVQPRNLDHPEVVGGDQLVAEHPPRQLPPLVPLPAVDAQAPLCVLELGLLKIVEELTCDLG